jgi:hypothetical protein
LPITASFNLGNSKFYFFWYNTTGGHFDQWTGSFGSWTKTPNVVSGIMATDPDGIGTNVNAQQAFGTFTVQIFFISGKSSPFSINAYTIPMPN